MAKKKKSSKDKAKKKTQVPPKLKPEKPETLPSPPITEDKKDVVKKKQPSKLPNPAETESNLDVGRFGHVNRASYDDSNLHKFILQNNLHGKVVRVVSDSSMIPVNGNLVTKYTIYWKE